jgi:hypothetical protein
MAKSDSTRPSYYELLKHPNWQRKRLEVMGRDGFKCIKCGAATDTLHVHHRYYTKGRAPWDYPDDCFQTLCENCHGLTHDIASLVASYLNDLPQSAQLNILGLAAGFMMMRDLDRPRTLANYDIVCGVALAFGLDRDVVKGALVDRSVTGRALMDIWQNQNK